jgi:hypothetical protein
MIQWLVKISSRKEKKETLSLSSISGEFSFPFGQKGNPKVKDKTNHISNNYEEWRH